MSRSRGAVANLVGGDLGGGPREGCSGGAPRRCDLLLRFLCVLERNGGMNTNEQGAGRPEMTAADRGGDSTIGMDAEAELATATLEQAMFWRAIYTEIVAAETSVLDRIRDLMGTLSPQARREVELTNVPVVQSQLDRFRTRLLLWEARVTSHE
jgi:hypothetical protein